MVTVIETLNGLRGKSIFFEPVGGNNGDTVIELGTRELFRRLDIQVHDNRNAAEVILINGNGGVGVELHQKNFSGLRQYTRGFPHTPVILLPSSFHFQGDRIGACFQGRSAPALMFARDRYSLERLQGQTLPPNVQIGLDDDMAFHLRGSELIESLKQRSKSKHVLLVERFDVEAAPGVKPREIQVSRKFKRGLPVPIRNFVKKIIHNHRAAQTKFTPATLQRLYREAPQYKGLPVIAQDISSQVGYTFDQFVDVIANAAVVVTMRLHVGILAALLDKPTYLIDANRAVYPKLKGIYEQSMTQMPNAHLW